MLRMQGFLLASSMQSIHEFINNDNFVSITFMADKTMFLLSRTSLNRCLTIIVMNRNLEYFMESGYLN